MTDWVRHVDVPGVYSEFSSPAGRRFGVYGREYFPANFGGAAADLAAGGLAPAEFYLYVDDLGATVKRAQELGANLASPAAVRGWGDEVAYLITPGGLVLALAAKPGP